MLGMSTKAQLTRQGCARRTWTTMKSYAGLGSCSIWQTKATLLQAGSSMCINSSDHP
jgi:hypothetical protein